MPTTLVPGLILDSRGRPMAPHGGAGTAYRRTSADDRLRPRAPNQYSDTAARLSPYTARELVSESRMLAARGTVNALIESKSDYVSASRFRPRFTGADSTFGTEALAWLTEALKIANIRGPRFTWEATWRLGTRAFADSGGFFVLLTKWPDTGQPAIQVLEAHRIGQRDDDKNTVEANDAFTDIVDDSGISRRIRGAYTGLRIHQGIITNASGTELAARVLGAAPADDQDISFRDLIFVATPKGYSEVRPVPDLTAGYLDFIALQLAQDAQLDLHMGDPRRDYIEETASGRPDPLAALAGNGPLSEAGRETDVVERGQIRFIKSGNKITPWETSRPSNPWMNFDERVLKRAARSVRWFAEMLDPAAITGSSNRSLQDQVNSCIFADFYAISPAVSRVLKYFVACGQQLGEIRPSDEWRMWDVAIPPEFRIDRQSARIDLEELAAGRTSMSILAAQDGHSAYEVMQSRAHDYKLGIEIAKANPGVPLEVILGTQGAKEPAAPANQAAPAQGSTRDNPQL